MKKFSFIIIIIISTFLMLASCGMIMGQMMGPNSVELQSSPYVGLVQVQGALMDPLPVLDQIRQHTQNKHCRGLVIRVDSPGGAVGAAQEIHQKISLLKAEGFPVAASYGNISASGGLYATVGATRIFANSGTITGSIGVITQFPEATELMKKVGVKMNILKSGEHKAMGNPFTPLDAGSQAKMQSVIEDTWMQFVEAVAQGRSLSVDSVKTFADGSIFTGRQALELGLIDELGGLESARHWIMDQTALPKGSDLIEIIPPKPLIDRLLKEPIAQAFDGIQSNLSQLPLFLWQ